MTNFFEYTKEDFTLFINKLGQKDFVAKQIFEWIYSKGVSDWEKMTNLSKPLRTELSSKIKILTMKQEQVFDSGDQETVRFLWRLEDDLLVESVMIRSSDRRTVCISTQVGCPIGCAFCASGKVKFQRNLKAAEIVEQVYQVRSYLKERGEDLSHIVFMGMGEPFFNFESVIEACKSFIDDFGISRRRITISTVGVVERIYDLAKTDLRVNLAISLHSPTQELRRQIIPYANKNPIEKIIEAASFYFGSTGRDITYEYILIAGFNDKEEHAEHLYSLLKTEQCCINLIPYNTVANLKFKRPSAEVIKAFKDKLEEKGLVVTCRFQKGDDINAACGQLTLRNL